MSDALELEQSLQEAEYRSRLNTLRCFAGHHDVESRVLALSRELARVLGDSHELTLQTKKSVLLAQARRRPPREIAVAMRRLWELAIDAQCAAETKRSMQMNVARFERLAGSPTWEHDYQAIVDSMERDFGQESIMASIARQNLVVALRGAAENVVAYSEKELEDFARRAHEAALSEWKLRRRVWGDANPFTWRSAAIRVKVGISAHLAGRPIEPAHLLLDEASQAVTARERLLGPEKRDTIRSRMDHALALALNGRTGQAVWRMRAVEAEAHEVQLDAPARLPLGLALVHYRHATKASLTEAEHYRDQAFRLIGDTHGPSSAQWGWAELVLNRAASG